MRSRVALTIAWIGAVMGGGPLIAAAQESATDAPRLHLELNALQTVEQACRLSFLARNDTGTDIDKAVFETVIFDAEGGVASLSLFDFRALPQARPRVRQFDLPGAPCEAVGRVLINGAGTCLIGGEASDLCDTALSLTSRLNVELIG